MVGLFILLAFTSCTKEESIIEVVPTQLTAAEFLALHVSQDILFQYSYDNPTIGVSNGWLIDKKGEVKTYELSSINNSSDITDKGSCTRTDLLNLYAYSKPNGTSIEAEELVAKYKQISDASYGILSTNQSGSEKEGTSTFYAIQYDSNGETYTSNTGCGNNCGNGTTKSPFARIILQQSGTNNRYNQSTAATGLVQWLSNIHETVVH